MVFATNLKTALQMVQIGAGEKLIRLHLVVLAAKRPLVVLLHSLQACLGIAL